MPKEIYVVAYEGDDKHNVLDYATEQAKKSGAALYILHVLEWSPYTFLTPEEIEERHARKKDELGRAKSAIIDPALERTRAAGVEAEGEIRYGSVVDLVVDTSKKKEATMIFVGRTGTNSLSARIFGSVPLGLAQCAPIPTVIVP